MQVNFMLEYVNSTKPHVNCNNVCKCFVLLADSYLTTELKLQQTFDRTIKNNLQPILSPLMVSVVFGVWTVGWTKIDIFENVTVDPGKK